ncbi:unnamed protein product [Trichobilharzia regenti]|nr:unnamed protein product [Trichobilharzia regenti]
MLGYVTIEVEGGDMDGAARHAQRLAGNFLDDMEAIQKASRARDRRAMSHFETNSLVSFKQFLYECMHECN